MAALVDSKVPEPEIVYAQAVLETGWFKSNLCREHNNLFGLYDSRNKCFYRFDHWVESVEAYEKWILNKYTDTTENYYHFLVRINYAEDPNYIRKLKQIVHKLQTSQKCE